MRYLTENQSKKQFQQDVSKDFWKLFE